MPRNSRRRPRITKGERKILKKPRKSRSKWIPACRKPLRYGRLSVFAFVIRHCELSNLLHLDCRLFLFKYERDL